MKRVEEFTLAGKNFCDLDLTGLNTVGEFTEFGEAFKAAAAKYPESSLYIVANFENIRFDSESKRILSDSVAYCAPYIKWGAAFGIDGITKMMMLTICKTIGWNNMHFAFTKAKAIEWLLQQE